jgi:uncharacterized protein DUF4192
MTTPTEPMHTARSIADQSPAVNLDQPGDLLAAIPHVLGFHPVDSLVVVGLHGAGSTTLGLLLRVDLPPPVRPAQLAGHLVRPLADQRAIGAALVVVGGHSYAPGEELPHRALVAACESIFAESGIPIVRQLWTPDTAGGARWRCYENADCAGIVPDPGSTALAAASAAAGLVTYNRREDLTARLAPVTDDLLARRADLLAAASRDTEPGGGGAESRERLRLIDTAVDRAVEGSFPETDEEFAALAHALGDHRVRDACLAPGDAVRAEAAERLWTELVRGTPAPERAEPACLLAFAAYLRGDGVQAGIALEQAEAAHPDHRLADLLRSALWTGLPPERMQKAGTQAAAHARRELTAPTPPPESR